NLRNQDYRPEDVGRPKAEVLAERIQGQAPGAVIEARTADLETLPLGLFMVDAIFGALDSRRARQALVSEAAGPLGGPVVGGGVGGSGAGVWGRDGSAGYGCLCGGLRPPAWSAVGAARTTAGWSRSTRVLREPRRPRRPPRRRP